MSRLLITLSHLGTLSHLSNTLTHKLLAFEVKDYIEREFLYSALCSVQA